MKKQYLILIIIIILLTGCKTKTYTVTFIDNNQELTSVIVKKGDNIKNIETPSKDGYLFLNWLKDGLEYNTSNPITEDIILTANWVEEPILPNIHKVTFDFGTYQRTQTILDGELATEPTTEPSKEKYDFLGWYLENEPYDFATPITEDITIKAKYEKNRIIINYDLKGAVGTVQLEIKKGSIPSIPKIPNKFGYTFTYWTINGKKYNFDTPLYDDVTIVANYEANVYVKVTYDTDGGNTISSQMLVSGESLLNLPVPTKEGYIFKYWSYDNVEFNINTKIIKDITLTAIYEAKEED